MSFLPEVAARRIATLSTVPRTLATSAPRAAFSTTINVQKNIADATKDTLKTVDRTVSDKLVDAIDVGSTVASKVKEVKDSVVNDTTGTAEKLKGEAVGKASELSGKAQGTASQMAGKAKGTASEMAGKVEGQASEVMGKTEGNTEKAAGKVKGTAERARKSL